MSEYKAVIFDLDGTLIDTIDDIADSMNHVLEGMGLPTHPVGAYKIFVGNGVGHLVTEAVTASGGTKELIPGALALYIEEYGRNLANKTRPYDGVAELVGELVSRGIKIAVLSNKPHLATIEVMRQYFPDVEFDVVFGQRENVRRKPYPDGAVEISETLKISPSQFLYLGDTNVDMATARDAGMTPVGALWGFRDEAELLEGGAKCVIYSPAGLLELL